MADDLLDTLTSFVRNEIMDPRDADELTADTPLLELGILTSVKLARMIAYIRSELGVRIPQERMVGGSFRDLASIAAMVAELRAVTA